MNANGGDDAVMSFWGHLDVLRSVLLKIVVAVTVFTVIAFAFKDRMFDIVLAPGKPTFITYGWISGIGLLTGAGAAPDFSVQIINTSLAGQFLIHVKTALCFGVIGASPFIVYYLFGFIAPALYRRERACTLRILLSSFVMFFAGIAVSYFIVFPLTFRFLGTYQVAGNIENMVTLDSYMSTLIVLSLSLGVIFEMPVLAWLLAGAGMLRHTVMTRYRRHAIVVILVAAAIITPTSDIFTLLVMSLPMWLLYEISILIVRASARRDTTPSTQPT